MHRVSKQRDSRAKHNALSGWVAKYNRRDIVKIQGDVAEGVVPQLRRSALEYAQVARVDNADHAFRKVDDELSGGTEQNQHRFRLF